SRSVPLLEGHRTGNGGFRHASKGDQLAARVCGNLARGCRPSEAYALRGAAARMAILPFQQFLGGNVMNRLRMFTLITAGLVLPCAGIATAQDADTAAVKADR